jgi:hypothetical protein
MGAGVGRNGLALALKNISIAGSMRCEADVKLIFFMIDFA